MAFSPIYAIKDRHGRSTLLPYKQGVDDGSTLNLDFTTGVLDPRLTFTRASNATFINSQGLVQWAAANMMTRSQSQDVNGYWNAFSTAVTRTASQTDPFGGSGAVKLDYNATSADAVISRSVSVQQGLQYTISVWLRADSGTLNNVRFGRAAAATGAYFPSLTTTWQRFSFTFTATGGTDGIELRVLTSGTPKTASFYVFGAQLEPGDTMRDYNPALLDVPYHAPRFDYDPTTRAPRGLLVEGQTPTINTYSESFDNAAWIAAQIDKTGMTSSQTDPAGGTNARILKADANAGRHAIYQIPGTGTNPGTGTLTVWAKSKELGFASLQLANAFESKSVTVTFDLATGATSGVVVSGMTHVASDAVQFRDGWWRLRLTATLTVGASPDDRMAPWIGLANASGSAGRSFTASGSGIFIWGAQFEAGTGASSYIPTGASTATRVADECVMTGTNFSSWFNAGSSYSMLFRYSLNNPSAFAGASIDRCAGTLSVSGGGNRTFIHAAYRTTSGSGDEGRFVRVFDTGSLDLSPATLPAAASNTRLAFAVDTNNAGLSAANQSLGTDSGCTILTGQNQLELGKVGSSQFINGCISLVKYWPTRLTNAQLQSLTT
jgi:hypothetical protein